MSKQVIRPQVTIQLSTPLFLIFLILKLTGTVNWSWFWVTSPLWIPFAVLALFLLLGLAIAVVAALVSK